MASVLTYRRDIRFAPPSLPGGPAAEISCGQRVLVPLTPAHGYDAARLQPRLTKMIRGPRVQGRGWSSAKCSTPARLAWISKH